MKLVEQPDLFARLLQEAYSAESQIALAMPRVVGRSTMPALRELLASHMRETAEQVLRLEQIGRAAGVACSGARSLGMQGLLAEGEETLGLCGDPVLVELAIAGACRKVEGYEIVMYGGLCRLADSGGMHEAKHLFEQSYREEQSAATKLESFAGEMLGQRRNKAVIIS